MDNILKYSIVISVSLSLSGCMGMMMGGDGMMGKGMMGGMHSNSMKMESSDTNKEHTSPNKSYIITKRYCTQCHEIKSKTLHTKKDWDRTIGRMLSYMKQQNKLQPDEYELIMIEHYYGVNEINNETSK